MIRKSHAIQVKDGMAVEIEDSIVVEVRFRIFLNDRPVYSCG
ncbi:MAG: hypothetical protein NTZ39_09035 [Methanoregula sp.]|nr:hypothetical protein [Methanoregula sp.]